MKLEIDFNEMIAAAVCASLESTKDGNPRDSITQALTGLASGVLCLFSRIEGLDEGTAQEILEVFFRGLSSSTRSLFLKKDTTMADKETLQ